MMMDERFAFQRLPMRALNAVLRVASRLGHTPTLDADALEAEARALTGLVDFGPVHYREGFERITREARSEGRLSPFGRLAMHGLLLELLETRLRLAADSVGYPEMSRVAIVAPIIVLGLPRTGSTLLHGLLGADPRNRAPLGWETSYPSPPPGLVPGSRDGRIRRARRSHRKGDFLAPSIRRIHETGAELPQECLAMLAVEMMSEAFYFMLGLREYRDWLVEHADRRPAFLAQRRMLQQLSYRLPERRWVLKNPSHLYSLDLLLEIYPDALIIQTHRDPIDAMPSIASLTAHIQALFRESVDLRGLGRESAAFWHAGLDRTLDVRERDPELDRRIFDLPLKALSQDPIGAVGALYEYFGIARTGESEAAMRAFLAAHPKDARGTHRYTLAEFGISREEEERRFARYLTRFPAVRATPRSS